MRRAAASLFLFVASPVLADTGDGGLPANFLTLGLGARAAGMGFASSAATNDSSAVLFNPGALARLSKGEAFAGDVLLPFSVSDLFLGGAWPMQGIGTFGVALSRLSEGSGEGRTLNNVSSASFTSNHTGILLGFGKQIGPAGLGASATVLQHGLGSVNQTGFTLSLGAVVDGGGLSPGLAGLSAGLKLGNIVPAKYGSASVPPTIRPGVEYRLMQEALVLAADADVTVGRNFRYAVGAEYTYRRLVSARAGFDGSPTAGFGGQIGPLRADYAVAFLMLGLSHRFSIAFTFGSDTTLPLITVKAPVFDPSGLATVNTEKVQLDILVESGEALKAVKIAGKPMRLTERNRFALKQAVGLREGKNPFKIEAETVSGKRAEMPLTIAVDTQPPTIEIQEPAQGARVMKEQVIVRAVVSDASEIGAVSVNDLPVFIQPAEKIEVNQPVTLRYGGRNVIRIAATDRMGNTGLKQVEVNREGGPSAPAGGGESRSTGVDEQTARQSLDKGKEYMRVGRYDIAAAELRFAVNHMPSLTEAKTLLTQCEQELVKAPAPTPAPAGGSTGGESSEMNQVRTAMDAHFARGKQLYDLGQYKRAEEEFKLVLELNKQFTAASDLLSKCRQKLVDFTNQKVSEAKAARAKGQIAKEMSLLRDVLVADDTNNVALEMQRQAISGIPAEKRRLHLRALDLYGQGSVEQALNVWKEARELDPEDEQIRKAIEKAEQKLIEQKSGNLGK